MLSTLLFEGEVDLSVNGTMKVKAFIPGEVSEVKKIKL